jgi:predicted nucleic-acid-binding protein
VISVDTNVLVRALVDDPAEVTQVRAARACMRKAKQVFVPQIVQAELVWVLESAYKLPKRDVIGVLEEIAGNLAFQLQQRESFDHALQAWRSGGADFADYLILAESDAIGCPLHSFDRKLGRARGVVQV